MTFLELPAMFRSRLATTKKRNNKGVLMKKLMMFAAAMTIVGGAFAQCELPTASNECALVYTFKASVKTTVAKAKIDCDEICYRNKGSKSLKGYLYVCSCYCEDFMGGSLWFEDTKTDEVFEGGLGWSILSRIGKKSMDAEGFWTGGAQGDENTGITMYAAGFGAFDSKTGVLKNMSGNIVGMMDAPICAKDCEVGAMAVAYPACDWESSEDVPTVLFGSWSISYNKKLSQKYYAGLWAPGL